MFKPRFIFTGAASVLAALMCAAVHAAAPVVPPDSIGPDTIAVIHVDAAHINPDLVKDTAKAVLGPNVESADKAISTFSENYDDAVKSGILGITVVLGDAAFVGADAGLQKRTSIHMYLLLKSDADVKAVERLIRSWQRDRLGGTDTGDQQTVEFERKGDFLVVHEKDMPLSTTLDAARAESFAEALGTLPDAALQIAIIPTPNLKKELAGQGLPRKEMKEARLAFANCKWAAIAVKLGGAPGITATVNAADAKDAKQLSDGINLGVDNAKQEYLANPKPGDLAGAYILGLIESLRPTTIGSQLTINISGDPFRTLAIFAAPDFKPTFAKSGLSRTKADLNCLDTAIEMYHITCGEYPKSLDALVRNPGTPGWQGPYLRKAVVPNDPWGHPYYYAFPGKRNAGSFDLWSDGDSRNPPDGLNNWTAPDANK